MTSRPWTEKHRQEALRRTYEIAAELVGLSSPGAAIPLAAFAAENADLLHEESWRGVLGLWLKPARIDREIHRVRGLAEGRLVRETEWCVVQGGRRVLGPYDSPETARQMIATYGSPEHPKLRRLRVTSIRRSSP